MSFWTQRFLPAAAAVGLILLLQPWHLRWWMIDVTVGVVMFLFSVFRDSTRPELVHAWLGFAASAALWVLGFLVAQGNGITMEELVDDQSLPRAFRRIPDYAVVLATFGVLLASWALLPAPSSEK